MTRFEEVVFEAFAGALFDQPVEPVTSFLVGLESTTPLRARLALRAAIWFVALSPFLFRGRRRSFSRLDLPARATHIATLLSHPSYFVRQLAFLLKAMATLHHVSHEAVRARLFREAPAPLQSGSRLIEGPRRLPIVKGSHVA